MRTGKQLSTVENRANVYPKSVNAPTMGVAKVLAERKPLNLPPQQARALKDIFVKRPAPQMSRLLPRRSPDLPDQSVLSQSYASSRVGQHVSRLKAFNPKNPLPPES